MARYDVWFTIAHPANLVIEAESPGEAEDIAQSILEEMDGKELMRKLKEAIDFEGLKIQYVEEVI